jgi:multiple sugar transport system substrate-binding protein
VIAVWVGMAGLVFALLGGCGGGDGGRAAGQPYRLTVWFHAGQAPERRVMHAAVRRFNAVQHAVRVHLVLIPEGSYNGQVQAAALAGDLPDVLEFDGPYVYNYVWEGKLIPLDGLLPRRLLRGLLPSIVRQGTYRGRLYSVAMFDSGLGLWGNRRELERAGVRIPASPRAAWSATRFDRVLAALARHDPDGKVLDLKLNYPGEWLTYAFSPLIESAGGDLLDRRTDRTAQGFLNGPGAVFAMEQVQSWFRKGYVDPNLDGAAFTGGRVALAWGGHWNYPRYHRALGRDLVLMPLPRFGPRLVTDSGSWNWGITTACRRPRLAARFLEFLLRPRQILAMTEANGAVPATRAALARSPLYRPGGPLRLFALQLEGGYAEPRPRTPAYPVISSAFQQAFRAIRNGANVRVALDRAVTTIDRDLRDNDGYPPIAVVRDRRAVAGGR